MKWLWIALLALPVAAVAQSPNPSIVLVTNAPSGSCSSGLPDQQTLVTGALYSCQSGTWTQIGSGGGGSTTTVCSGTVSLGTSAIASGAAATTVTATCTGLASTDNIMLDFNASPLAVTGYTPSASGMLAIIKWPTTNTINVSVVNNTGSSITPGAITLNYRVVR